MSGLLTRLAVWIASIRLFEITAWNTFDLDEPKRIHQRFTAVSVVGPVLSPSVTLVNYLRSFFAAFLCVAALLGHAPAWLHFVSCDDCVIATRDARAVETDSRCQLCCHHHDLDTEPNDQHQPIPHDPNTCAICMSLACPAGAGWPPWSPPICELVSDRAPMPSVTALHTIRIAAANPRGPPVSIEAVLSF